MLKLKACKPKQLIQICCPLRQKNYRIQRKADYAFSFHRNTPQVSDLYNKLNLAGKGDRISQTMDANTRRLALFSGIEVKQENGGKDEALAQLAIWLAAGLENLRRLSKLGRKQPHLDEELHPTVGWTVIGHDWYTYIAYRANQDGRDTFNVVGPWRVAAADTRDVYGFFKLLRLLKRAAEFASHEYWPWLRNEVLDDG